MNRRAFIKSTGVALFGVTALGAVPAFLQRAVAGTRQDQLRRKVLVVIFQRGAMDGLMAVPVLGDSYMQNARPHLWMNPVKSAGDEGPAELDGKFGLHPGLAPLLPLFTARQLAIVHAVGSPEATRSHFDAQDYMETGTPGNKGTQSGWLNRAAGMLKNPTGTAQSPFRSVSVTSALPRSLYGPQPALAVADLADFKVRVPGADMMIAQEAGKGFEALYEQTSQGLLRGTGHDTFQATKMLEKIDPKSYRPEGGAAYPRSPLGQALQQIAQLIKAGVGLEIAFAESGGWDTHVAQGTGRGTFARNAQDLAGAMGAFWKDLGKLQEDVTVMTMTEFGRTVQENGAGGTDHGRGSCLFVLGGDVQGGKVHGRFPASLAAEHLEDGRDLPVLNDFRSVFSAVAGHHLGITNDAALFPGWTGKRMDLMR